MTRQTAIVVGGGIAGLAAAIALVNQDWKVTVLERRETLGEVGAGFAMARNAVTAFRGLGFVEDDVAALGFPTRAAGTFEANGRSILTISDDPSTRKAVGLIGVHRKRIHAALLNKARNLGVEVHSGARISHINPGEVGGQRAVIGEHEADLVVAADGMNSSVRDQLFPATRASYSGYSSWRAITARGPDITTLRQYWGPHAEFGIMPVSETDAYWYGYVAMPAGMRFSDELEAARKRFDGWAPPVVHELAITDPSALIRHDVYYLPRGLPRYYRGRVVVIGDAAHGTLPTMGQGVALALEDGLCVGLLIGAVVRTDSQLSDALRTFDSIRRPRGKSLGRASYLSGKIGAHLGPGLRQTVRNSLMRITPAAAVNRGADAAMGWQPPR